MSAVIGDRLAVDILHDEERRSVSEDAGIVEAGDRRMIELRQHALLDREPVTAGGRKPGVAQDLEGYPAAHVLALRQVDHAHAPFAQHPLDPIGVELRDEWR